ncbi:MAG: Bug family tripartite tricarboxylate transporter substrate binding protein, partial [Gammaproteobacteria bacterium]
VLVVNKAVPAGTVRELIEFIKGQDGKANMGSAGAGTPGHLAGEMFKSAMGLQFTHVPYRGGAPAINDLLGGQIQFLFTTIPGVLPQIQAGNARALAVTSPQRSSALPDVPTMVEAGVPNFRALSWHGIVAPAGTPPAVVETLDRAFTASLATPKVKERLDQEGAIPASLHAGEFGAFIKQEIDTWGKAVKSSGASVQ